MFEAGAGVAVPSSEFEFAQIIVNDIRRKNWPDAKLMSMKEAENAEEYKESTETKIGMTIRKDDGEGGKFSILVDVAATTFFNSKECERHRLLTVPQNRPKDLKPTHLVMPIEPGKSGRLSATA